MEKAAKKRMYIYVVAAIIVVAVAVGGYYTYLALLPKPRPKLSYLEGTGARSKDLIEKAKKWCEEKGIDLVVTMLPGLERFQKLAIASEAGVATYDLIALWGPMVISAAGKGYITPLDDLVPTGYFDQYMPMDEAIYQGKHYGLPYLTETIVLFYRTDLFEQEGLEVPTTAEELIEAAKRLTKDLDGDGVTDIYGFAPFWGNAETTMCIFAPILFSVEDEYGWGTWAIEEDGKVIPAFNGTAGVTAIEFWLELLDAGVVPPSPMALLQDDVSTLFAEGKIAMFITWAGLRGYIDDPEISVLKSEQWSFALVPKFDRAWSLTGSDFFSVAELSEEKELATELGMYLISEEVQKEIFLTRKVTPSIKALYEDPECLEMYGAEKLRVMLEQTLVSGFKPLYWWADEFYPILNEEVQKALLREKTPKQALDDAAERLAEIIERGP